MSVKFRKGIDVVSNRIINLADGTGATDAVTLQQLQAVQRGIDWKDSVRAASTANVTIASALINASSMDGVTLATGDRVLLKNQTAAAENGIYIVAASGAASRSTDADISTEVTAGMAVSVEEGTTNGDKVYQLTTNNPITLGTTPLTFSILGGSGVSQAYQTVDAAGTPLTQRSTLNFGAGLSAVDNSGSTRTDVTLDTSVAVKKYAADCVVTTNPQTFTHGLGTDDVTVAVWASNELVYPDITKGSGTVIIDWGAAPTAAQYRVVIHG